MTTKAETKEQVREAMKKPGEKPDETMLRILAFELMDIEAGLEQAIEAIETTGSEMAEEEKLRYETQRGQVMKIAYGLGGKKAYLHLVREKDRLLKEILNRSEEKVDKRKKIININSQVITKNLKDGLKRPPITTKTHDSNTYGSNVKILGPDGEMVCEVVYSPDNPAKGGTRCYIVTYGTVLVDDKPISREEKE